MRVLFIFVPLCLLLSPLPVIAEQSAPAHDRPRLIISERAIADAISNEQPSSRDQRDSVKNGAIIGAVIGAAVMGGFVTFLCHALKEPGDPPCWKSSGVAIGIGAGAGALGGAGIDALLARERRQFLVMEIPLRKPVRGLP